jgi:hypothetical protein
MLLHIPAKITSTRRASNKRSPKLRKSSASPYPGKTEVNTYDFHASLLNYNLIGRTSGGTIQTGDLLELYWDFQSNSAVGKASVICTVPLPGVG